MSDPSPLLDRAGIEDALRRLGERLAKRGVVADLYVFGGAAMALAYDSRRATRDVDALFKPHGIVHEEALAVAAELGLPRWWLNEQASSYVAPGGDPEASRVFDHPGLRVFAASPEHLLAMKAFAARPRDIEDIRQLAKVLDLHNTEDVLSLVREVFPGEAPPERLRLLLDDIFSDGESPAPQPDRSQAEGLSRWASPGCTTIRMHPDPPAWLLRSAWLLRAGRLLRSGRAGPGWLLRSCRVRGGRAGSGGAVSAEAPRDSGVAEPVPASRRAPVTSPRTPSDGPP